MARQLKGVWSRRVQTCLNCLSSDTSLDAVALFLCPLRVGSEPSAVGLGRGTSLALLVLDDLTDPVGVIGTIGEYDKQ